MAIIMPNADTSEICPFINFIWEQHHQLVYDIIVQIIYQCLLFAAKLVPAYDFIDFREMKGFEFLIVLSYDRLLRKVK